jgi:hypothetical protein
VDWLKKSAQLLRVQENDALLASLIERQVEAEKLLLAADVLLEQWQATDGQKWALLEQSLPKDATPSAAHRVLAGLPFAHVITTNYDKLVEDGYAAVHQKTLNAFSNSEDQIKAAERWSGECICHIHARWKEWESIVFSSRQYERIVASAAYQLFMRSTLGTKPVLFLGYGGTDPDINCHLQWVAQNVGKRRPRFWVGAEPSPSTRELLTLCDVEVIAYPAGEHRCLLDLLSALPARDHLKVVASTASVGSKDELIRFAVFLTGRRWGGAVDSSVDAALSLSTVRTSEDYASTETLAKRIQETYRIAPATSREIAIRGIRVLAEMDRQPEVIANEVKQAAGDVTSAVKLMATVVEMACGASTIRSKFPAMVQEVLATMLMTDGLALASQLAGTGAPKRSLPIEVLRGRAAEVAAVPGAPTGLVDALVSSVQVVLKSEEEDVRADLVRLARAAFLLNARFIGGDLISKARDRVLQPLYLDANVLLPIIVPEFPTSSALSSLVRLARAHGVELRFLSGFANEVRSHKEQALQTWKNDLNSDRRELEAYLAATAPLGGNVYLRGFASGESESLDDYLADSGLAFTSDDAVVERLVKDGYRWTETRKVEAHRRGRISQIKEAIIDGKKVEGRFRDARVCEHEAIQLAQVEMEVQEGRPSLFLTHDRALYRIACRIPGGDLAPLIQDPRVLGYLIANENRAVDASMAPLLFGIVEADARSMVMSLATEKIVERIVRERDEFETLEVAEAYQRLVAGVEEDASLPSRSDTVPEKVAAGRGVLRRVNEALEAMLEMADVRRKQLDKYSKR